MREKPLREDLLSKKQGENSMILGFSRKLITYKKPSLFYQFIQVVFCFCHGPKVAEGLLLPINVACHHCKTFSIRYLSLYLLQILTRPNYFIKKP